MAGTKEMSLLAQFDDICRGFNFWMNDPHREFETFARNQEECRLKWLSTEERCSSVLKELNEARASREKLELQVRHVTELLKSEIQIRQRLQKEEKDLERKLNMVKQIVSTDRNIGEETRDKLVSISSIDSYYRCDLESPGDQLIDTTSDEIESSTRSILSSLDITSEKTDEDLELSIIRSVRDVRARRSNFLVLPVRNSIGDTKRTLEQTFLAPPKPTIATPNPPAGKTSSISSSSELSITPKASQLNGCHELKLNGPSRETTPVGNEVRRSSSVNRVVRQHNLASKVILKQEVCTPCKTRIRFGKSAMKCVDCFMTCHIECKSTMPTPCVPMVRTPTHFVGSIADYSPKTSPMIPALLVHCLEEIELRGLEEVGIYRITASDKEIHTLKEKLLNGKVRAGQLTGISIHVITGVVRSFLTSLKEPLVTYTSRESFTKISYIQDETDVQTTVCTLVPELPQPNRDTLAYLMLHLQRVAESRSCRMSAYNLAKTFGPMVIGCSRSPAEDGLKKLQDLKEQQMAMEKLLSIPSDYWSCYGRYTETVNNNNTPVNQQKRNVKRTGFFTSPHF